MIIEENKKDVMVQAGKASSFKIQASSKAFQILSSNIYKNKIAAIIREVSCNAHDSHVAAKNPDPFDVHLPTNFENWFSVRDYGTGLSDEDVREIYTTYFCSTKSNSNEFIGALGLGSKSPFCWVDSFTVTSFFNGIKRNYSCYKDENGEPQTVLLSESETDEKNGVCVSIVFPKNDTLIGQKFAKEACNVFKFFEKLPNINSEDVKTAWENFRKSGTLFGEDRLFNIYDNSVGLYAVMGNVAYIVPHNDVLMGKKIKGYLKFNLGELNFDPGREYVTLDDKTYNKILERLNFLENKITDFINTELSKCSHEFYKYKMYNESYTKFAYFDKYNHKYSNYKLPKNIGVISGWKWNGYRYDNFNVDYIPIEDNFIFVKAKDDKFSESRVKSIVRHLNKKVLLITSEFIKHNLIPDDKIVDILSINIPNNNSVLSTGVRNVTSVCKVVKYNPVLSISSNKRGTGVELKTIDLNNACFLRYQNNRLLDFHDNNLKLILNELQDRKINVPEIYLIHDVKFNSKALKGKLNNFYNYFTSIKNQIPDKIIENIDDVSTFLYSLRKFFNKYEYKITNKDFIKDGKQIVDNYNKILKSGEGSYLQKHFGKVSTSEDFSKSVKAFLKEYPIIEIMQDVDYLDSTNEKHVKYVNLVLKYL